MAHGTAVQVIKQNRDRRVQIDQTEEAPVSEPSQYPSLDDQHCSFDLGFVARFTASGRKDSRIIMFGHGREGGVERGLKPQRLGDACLQVITHDRLGDPSEEAQRTLLALDPVWQFLAEAGAGECQ